MAFTAATQDLPNFVVILADDLGYGDLGFNGHPSSSSPNLDRIMAKSLIFRDFYTVSPVCSPSRAALLTGLYPISTGIYPGVFFPTSIGGLDPANHSTIAKYLRAEKGYKTTHIGKWHLGVGQNGKYLPTRHGFDHYYGIPYSHDMCPCSVCFPNEDKCFDGCREDSVSCPLFWNTEIVEQPTRLPELTDKYTRKALEVIKGQGNNTQPFFLYVAYHQTHHPQFAGDKFRNNSLRGSFGDALMEMDHSIGQIIDALHQEKLMGNTYIFFTSDNGPSLMRHERGGNAGLFRCGKGTTWEGGLRVPAFVYSPTHVPPGETHELSSTLDFVPTILALARISSQGIRTHGFDMSPLFTDRTTEIRDSLLMFPMDPHPSQGPYAIRYKEFKAHYFTRGSSLSDDDNFDRACRSTSIEQKHVDPLIMNLHLDPSERFDLSASQVSPQVRAQFKQIQAESIANMSWATSEMDKGQDRYYSPCCDKPATCEPFPKCCDCETKNSATSITRSPSFSATPMVKILSKANGMFMS
eukprot:snap_masked-scaffold1177_size57108-processed-gene-0.3 protein:Tk09749 transcript:snap_masked-scaffold1177_size57108-processed-gene-0.3-mRNA-1 annotation:"arylsulfatase a-like"